MNKPLVFVGMGGHASVLLEMVQQQGLTILGYTGSKMDTVRLRYLGSDDYFNLVRPEGIELVMGLGMVEANAPRQKLFNDLKNKGFQFKTIIHPSAIISPSVVLGEGVQVMAGTIIQTHCKISDNTIINTGAQIDHDCVLHKHVHIAPRAVLSGGVIVGEGTHIGVGAIVIQNIRIGEGVLIAAGAVVVGDIKNQARVKGIPAKEV